MQPPHQHSRISLAELKAQIVRKLGPERSKQYFNLLNRLLSLKLNKVEFNKICIGIVGKENIPLHNQFIRSVLKNAYTAKVPPKANEVEVLNSIRAAGNKETSSDVYQQNGSHPVINQPPNPPALSNGDILPLSPRKARTGTRDRRIMDRRTALVSNEKTIILENGESIPTDSQRAVQHHQVLKQQTGSEVDTVSVHSTDQAELFAKRDGKGVSARRLIHPPLGIPFCAASAGGARRALPLASTSRFVSSFNSGDLLDTTKLRERMQQIATTQGLEGMSVDCANMVHNGLSSYLKGLIRSCLEVVGPRSGFMQTNHSSNKNRAPSKLVNGVRPGYHYQMQNSNRPAEVVRDNRPHGPISLRDFKAAMELNPHQLGEDWPLLLEKICTHAFEEDM